MRRIVGGFENLRLWCESQCECKLVSLLTMEKGWYVCL